MSTIQIPASELKTDDELSIAGHNFRISPWLGPRGRIIAYQMHDGEQVGAVEFPPDMLLTVTRPDPDAELIEVMAKAYRDALGLRHHVSGWDDLGIDNQIGVRADMRAALAAAREAGLL